MRFHADSSVLKALKNNKQLTLVGPNIGSAYWPVDAELKSDYARAVNWGEATHIQNPICYDFHWNPRGEGWFGVIVVDEKRHVLYAYGGLL